MLPLRSGLPTLRGATARTADNTRLPAMSRILAVPGLDRLDGLVERPA